MTSRIRRRLVIVIILAFATALPVVPAEGRGGRGGGGRGGGGGRAAVAAGDRWRRRATRWRRGDAAWRGRRGWLQPQPVHKFAEAIPSTVTWRWSSWRRPAWKRANPEAVVRQAPDRARETVPAAPAIARAWTTDLAASAVSAIARASITDLAASAYRQLPGHR